MFSLPAFVVVPNSDDDWATNWDVTKHALQTLGGGVIYLGLFVGACALLAKVRVRRARPATRSLPERPAVTIGSGASRAIQYVIGPFTRFWVERNREAIAPMFEQMRDENVVQHTETASRLSALEDAVKDLSAWRDTVDAIMRPSESIEALVNQMQSMANIVQADRHAAKAGLAALNGQMQLLMQMLADRQSTNGGD